MIRSKIWGRMVCAWCITIPIALGSALPLQAAFLDGNSLYAECSAPQGDAVYYSKASRCMGYILGVYDDMMVMLQLQYRREACAPSGVTAGQIVDIVTKYLRDNPQERHMPAPMLVRIALFEAFPACRVASE